MPFSESLLNLSCWGSVRFTSRLQSEEKAGSPHRAYFPACSLLIGSSPWQERSPVRKKLCCHAPGRHQHLVSRDKTGLVSLRVQHLVLTRKPAISRQPQFRGARSSAADPSDVSKGGGREIEDWFAANDGLVRLVPLVAGAVGGALVVLNRALSGIPPVADGASAQSRADVICLALAATLVLNGLIWKSIEPKKPVSVVLEGRDCLRLNPGLPSTAASELLWAWDAVQSTTRCKGVVAIWRGVCAFQAGVAAATVDGEPTPVDAATFVAGNICRGVLESGRANYMANLTFFPGRFEFAFFPPNTQAVLVQPIGDEGVLLLATDTIRGFTPLDQVWAVSLAEKLDISLQEWNLVLPQAPAEPPSVENVL